MTNGTEAVAVTIGGLPAVVSFCGPAPGLPPGVFQVTATVPPGVAGGDAVPVAVEAGNAASLPSITIAVK